MDRTAAGRVEQHAEQAAVDDAGRVVRRLVGRAAEYRLAVADRMQPGADQGRKRRHRQLAVDDRLQDTHARQVDTPAVAEIAGSYQLMVFVRGSPQSSTVGLAARS